MAAHAVSRNKTFNETQLQDIAELLDTKDEISFDWLRGYWANIKDNDPVIKKLAKTHNVEELEESPMGLKALVQHSAALRFKNFKNVEKAKEALSHVEGLNLDIALKWHLVWTELHRNGAMTDILLHP